MLSLRTEPTEIRLTHVSFSLLVMQAVLTVSVFYFRRIGILTDHRPGIVGPRLYDWEGQGANAKLVIRHAS